MHKQITLLKWSIEEIDFLKTNYPDMGKKWCMDKLNKSEKQVRHAASKIGLRLNRDSDHYKEFQERAANSKIGKLRKKHKLKHTRCESCWTMFNQHAECRRKTCSDFCLNALKVNNNKEYFKSNGHPKGMLGKTHTDEYKKQFSERVKRDWNNPNSVYNTPEYRQKLSDNSTFIMRKYTNANPYSRTKCGWVEIGGKRFFSRSSWEANIGAYFELLKSKGEIIDWEHEPQTFWFEEIKRGVRSYLPDYRITNNDGSTYFVEVKGWMDDKSKTKLKRMAKYYPEVKLDLIDAKRYRVIEKNKSIIPMWGLLDNQKKS